MAGAGALGGMESLRAQTGQGQDVVTRIAWQHDATVQMLYERMIAT